MRIGAGRVLAGVAVAGLAGCAAVLPFGRAALPPALPPVAVVEAPGPAVIRPAPRPQAGPGAQPRTQSGAQSGPLTPRGRTAEAIDRTTDAQRAAAAQAAREDLGQDLGATLASLGAPTEPGFWLATGLVDRPRPGRVVAEGGAAVAVELRPSGGAAGAGSQISLAALRTLGLPLTGLAPLRVYALD